MIENILLNENYKSEVTKPIYFFGVFAGQVSIGLPAISWWTIRIRREYKIICQNLKSAGAGHNVQSQHCM